MKTLLVLITSFVSVSVMASTNPFQGTYKAVSGACDGKFAGVSMVTLDVESKGSIEALQVKAAGSGKPLTQDILLGSGQRDLTDSSKSHETWETEMSVRRLKSTTVVTNPGSKQTDATIVVTAELDGKELRLETQESIADFEREDSVCIMRK